MKLINERQAETVVQQSDAADVPTSSPSSTKPHVSGSRFRWVDAKKELPKCTKGRYSDADVFLVRMFKYDIGRTYDGKWVNMQNEPLEDVILWAYKPKLPDEFRVLFDCR